MRGARSAASVDPVGARSADTAGRTDLAEVTDLLRRYPNLKLAVPPEQLEWRKSTALRGLVHLPVRLA